MDAGAHVVGISADGVESHKRFADKYQLQFRLLADPDRSVHALFGVSKMFFLIPRRITYVFDKQGALQHSFESSLNFKKHVDEALRVVKELSNTEAG